MVITLRVLSPGQFHSDEVTKLWTHEVKGLTCWGHEVTRSLSLEVKMFRVNEVMYSHEVLRL